MVKRFLITAQFLLDKFFILQSPQRKITIDSAILAANATDLQLEEYEEDERRDDDAGETYDADPSILNDGMETSRGNSSHGTNAGDREGSGSAGVVTNEDASNSDDRVDLASLQALKENPDEVRILISIYYFREIYSMNIFLSCVIQDHIIS